MMQNRLKKYAVAFILCVIAHVGYSADLLEIYQMALNNDTEFQQAYTTFLSNKEVLPQAQSALLPQLSFQGDLGTERVHVLSNIEVDTAFPTRQWQLNASQAVFNYNAWSAVMQASIQVRSAQATFNDSAENLILRITKAYMDALLANDTLAFAKSKKLANKRQYEQAEERFKVGLDTITSVYEAKAGYDQSVAEVIAAENNRINQYENIRKFTNHYEENLATLKNGKVPLISPTPARVDDWISAGLKQNYKLAAARYNQQAARENIKTITGKSMPVVAFTANATRGRNFVGDTSFFVPFVQDTTSALLTVNMPLFQGGLNLSQVRQATYDYQTSSSKFDGVYRDVLVNTRIAFNTIKDGMSKIRADKQTLDSQRNSLESTEAQFQVGTRTMVDVVDAQRKLFDAQRILAEDQYKYINSVLALKYLAGTLSVEDVQVINGWLNGNKPRMPHKRTLLPCRRIVKICPPVKTCVLPCRRPVKTCRPIKTCQPIVRK